MQSTPPAGKGDLPYTQWCVVYDRRTGAVVHVHQHIALSRREAYSSSDLASQAIEQAARRRGKEFLDVAHPADDTPLSLSARYRVDVTSGRVQWQRRWRFRPEDRPPTHPMPSPFGRNVNPRRPR